ncbi:MAG: tetratricopeptide repeat protein [Actinobacteria bacterium]|nr:MAG: tetratricopeptide repeat protein [Actinomycetota bacterium]
MTAPADSGSVRVGAYSLEVATLGGSFAQFEPEPEDENAGALEAALEAEAGRPQAAVAAVEQFEETADAVTGRIEQADKLRRAAAAGDLLRLDNVTGEIDGLLDLFARLDKAGRFEEELKLMRSLNGLLALTLRWLDLIRSLRSLLSSAEAAGHAAGQAFAHHELGSLNLCAGRAQEASEHLREAFRLESQIGDLAGQCATRHNLDSARRDALARRGWGRRPRRLLRSAVIAAAFLLGGGGGTALALVIGRNDGGGDHSPATLIVRKDFVPNAPAASVTISVTCTNGGRPDKSPKTASEAAPAVFTITHLGNDATCTAGERPSPAGYTATARGCRDVSIAAGESRSCTITNRRKGVGSATLIVRKDFVPDVRGASVTVSVSCTNGGRPDKPQKAATEAAPAVFKITRFGKRATCTASEGSVPSGYAPNARDCQQVAISRGASPSCRIINTRASVSSATFTVTKDFSDDSTLKVSIGLSCDSGTVAETPVPAAEGVPATFSITGFGSGTTCTATEGTPPPGYKADDVDCRRVAIADRTSPSCTIVDTLNTTTLTVHKEFTDGNTSTVSISLTCSSGSIDDSTQTASPSSPANFTITGFVAGVTCSATENKLPSGYSGDASDCQDVPLVSRGECTIVNSPPG